MRAQVLVSTADGVPIFGASVKTDGGPTDMLSFALMVDCKGMLNFASAPCQRCRGLASAVGKVGLVPGSPMAAWLEELAVRSDMSATVFILRHG